MKPIIDILKSVRHRMEELECDQNSESFAMLTWATVLSSRIEGFLRLAIKHLLLLPPGTSTSSALDLTYEFLAAVRSQMKGIGHLLAKVLKITEASGDIAGAAAIHAYQILLKAHADDEEMRNGLSLSTRMPVDARGTHNKYPPSLHTSSMSIAHTLSSTH